MKKKVTIIGGAGTIGSILVNGLSDTYDFVILDKNVHSTSLPCHAIEVDATNYQDLLDNIPKDTDAIVNLLTIKSKDDLKNIEQFHKMTNIHFIASFYLLHAAVALGIKKLVYASSNHATDYYEKDGRSTLDRKISIHDYPLSKGLYGVLKLASENIGHIFAGEKENNLSVINLRIGSVLKDEYESVKKQQRLHHTLLSHEDTIQLFHLALQSTVKYGTYYGVSDNPNKPWSTENAWEELGFSSEVNAVDVLNRNIDGLEKG
ncbi:NAD-dependent epimerase/dehydratase family protein [Metabacillus halosaccharovorans]|uniref:NAD-dependent epimerase/dehydratase family protein n=1 Tax=Metabacillus halosaccharovorans TaxID=930124 RepID=UPI001C1F8A58|nr:NAD-dependent epimerase/dehydratase family protein [Metabacillus halosaccharovorans]MBU7595575.1 NAD-dependent epimerase/dehydratase family protein [Metabacillus halosaccharovorans]